MEPLSFSQIGMAFVALVNFMMVGALVWNVLNARRTQKREVSFSEECVRRNEFKHHIATDEREFEKIHSRIGGVERGVEDRLGKKMDALRSELRADVKDIADKGEERASKIHDRINDLGNDLTKSISELKGEIKRMS
jgi:hypothetical protein